MKNKITESYIVFLRNYIKNNPNSKEADVAAKLILMMKDVKSISQLIKILTPGTKTQAQISYYDIKFYTQLHAWKTDLELINTNRAVAQCALNNLKNSNDSLTRFIKSNLDEDHALHGAMRSLLVILCSPQLPQVVEYLAQIKQIPLAKNPPRGSFFTLEIKSDDQRYCIERLHCLSCQFNETNPLWTHANSLLQILLTIDKEFSEAQIEEVGLDDSDHGKSTCLIQ